MKDSTCFVSVQLGRQEKQGRRLVYNWPGAAAVARASRVRSESENKLRELRLCEKLKRMRMKNVWGIMHPPPLTPQFLLLHTTCHYMRSQKYLFTVWSIQYPNSSWCFRSFRLVILRRETPWPKRRRKIQTLSVRSLPFSSARHNKSKV